LAHDGSCPRPADGPPSLAALAGLVVYAAIQLIDVQQIRRVVAFRRSEAALMVAASVGVWSSTR
jgi:MFS superfamily sulfate permease-like transporter